MGRTGGDGLPGCVLDQATGGGPWPLLDVCVLRGLSRASPAELWVPTLAWPRV